MCSYLISGFFGRFSDCRLLVVRAPVVVGVVLVVAVGVGAVEELSLLAGVEEIMLFGRRRRFILFFHFLKLVLGPEANILTLFISISTKKVLLNCFPYFHYLLARDSLIILVLFTFSLFDRNDKK